MITESIERAGQLGYKETGLKAYYLNKAIGLAKNIDNVRYAKGFIIKSSGFKGFLDINAKNKINNLLKLVDIGNKAKTQAIANSIQKIIISIKMPYETKAEIINRYHELSIMSDESLREIAENKSINVVARASPSVDEKAYFPEHYIDFINISNEDELIKKTKLCWASLYTAKAIEDRKKEDIENIENISMAVVVQKAINFDSCARATANNARIKIKAVAGNLKALEDNEYDSYSVIRDSIEIEKKIKGMQKHKIILEKGMKKLSLSKEEQEKQKISDESIIKISRIAKAISKGFGNNISIDIGIKGNTYYILSAYKIDEEKEEKKDKEKRIDEIISKGSKDEEKDIAISVDKEKPETEKQMAIDDIAEEDKKSLFSELSDMSIFSIFKRKKEKSEEQDNKEEDKEREKKEDEKTKQMQLSESTDKDKEKSILPFYKELSKMAVVCDMMITEELRKKYREIFSDKEERLFEDMINEIKEKQEVPLEEEIKKVRALRNKVLEKGIALKKEDIIFCINAAEEFIKRIS